MTSCAVAKFNDLKDRDPSYALIGEVDLVVVRMMTTCLFSMADVHAHAAKATCQTLPITI